MVFWPFPKDLGSIEQINFQKVFDSVQTREDFMGVQFEVNYAETYPPYCYADEDGNLKGIFYEIMNVAAKYVNVSLIYKYPQEHNVDIWSSRYFKTSILVKKCSV